MCVFSWLSDILCMAVMSAYWPHIIMFDRQQEKKNLNPKSVVLKETSDILGEKDSAESIYLTHKTTWHVSVWNTEDCRHIYENEILLQPHGLIDANASQFSALQCHQMKISQQGEQINTELCHAIFVSHYIWFLFIPEEVQNSLELYWHNVQLSHTHSGCDGWWKKSFML